MAGCVSRKCLYEITARAAPLRERVGHDKGYQSGTEVSNSMVGSYVDLGGRKSISLLKMYSN